MTWRDNNSKRFIIDNGAGTLKCSLATTEAQVVLNAVGQNKKTGKVFIGNKLRDELEKGAAHLQITNPLIRGLLHDSDLETMLWKQCFSKYGRKFDEKVSCLCLTVPPVIPDIVQNRLLEVVFEDLSFDAYA